MTNTTVQRMTIRAVRRADVAVVGAVFAYHRWAALTHLRLEFDLQNMRLPLGQGVDYAQSIYTDSNPTPKLARVELSFTSCASDLSDEAKDELQNGIMFLRVCRQNDVLVHAVFS
jgi:hypothetical protein